MSAASVAQAVPVPVVRPDRITMAAFAGMVLMAGASPVGVRITTLELAPFWAAGIRFGAASILLLAFARFRKVPFPRGGDLAGPLVFGILGIVGFFGFVYVAFRHIPASIGTPLVASVPLLTLILAAIHRLEPFRWRGLIGGVTSVAGIAVLSGAGGTGGAPVKYLLFVIIASACAAEGSILLKKLPKIDPFMMNAVAMMAASAIFFSLSFATSERHALPHTGKAWGWLIFLIVGGSTLLFMFYVTVLNRWTVTGASYQFVLFPIVTVILASFFADEHISASLASGAALVLGGVYIGAFSGRMHLRHHKEQAAPEPIPCQPC
jgi:drug/metabolite transporter (DMT)-like permease